MGMNIGPLLSAEQEFRQELINHLKYWENRQDGQQFARYYKEMLYRLFSYDEPTGIIFSDKSGKVQVEPINK